MQILCKVFCVAVCTHTLFQLFNVNVNKVKITRLRDEIKHLTDLFSKLQLDSRDLTTTKAEDLLPMK